MSGVSFDLEQVAFQTRKSRITFRSWTHDSACISYHPRRRQCRITRRSSWLTASSFRFRRSATSCSRRRRLKKRNPLRSPTGDSDLSSDGGAVAENPPLSVLSRKMLFH
ncbi:unnamed protein product [Amoebophrya sp. A120]|nr:unnamed protein product [Amoebophrya sp. A120]|eukprot:GSA120T00004095001.1